MQTIQSISCTNDAAFVMNFWIEWVDPSNGNNGWTNTNSGDYSVGHARTLDLDALNTQGENIPEGVFVRPRVQATLGTNNAGNQYALYRRGANDVANYNVTGTTTNIDVSLVE